MGFTVAQRWPLETSKRWVISGQLIALMGGVWRFAARYRHAHNVAMPRRPPPHLPAVDLDRCTGCGWCVAACPPHVLSLQVLPHRQGRKGSTLHAADACTGCALCERCCPFGAIRMGPNDAAGAAAQPS